MRTSSQLSASTAASIEEFFDEARASMAVVARRPLVRRADAATCDPSLRDAALLHPYAAGLNVENLAGQVVCASLPAPPEGLPSVAASAWFQQARRTGRFTVSEPFLGRISHKRISVLVLPIVERGRRTGYLSLPIDLVRFQERFARLAADSKALVSIVTESGVIVTRSIEADKYVGKRLPPEAVAVLHDPPSVGRGVDGIERIYARTPVEGTSWIVVSGMPTSIAYGASNRLVTVVMILCFALFMFSLLAAIVTGRLIARPVQALAQRASDVAAGRGGVAGPLRGPYEVVVAARQFDETVTALWDSEQQLTHVLDAAGMGAWAIDVATGRTWRSARHDRIFGHKEPVADWSIEIALERVVPDDRAHFREQMARAASDGQPFGFECRIAWPDGSKHQIRIEGLFDHDANGEPTRGIGTVADVSDRVRGDDERRQLEEELRQSQKMEAVGQLAGGIAHDFNNLLTAISGYSELALAEVGDAEPELRAHIEEIARAGERAAQLTRQLLAFSRRQTLQTTVFDLNDAISDSETLLRRLLGSHIDILCALAPHECAVDADRGQIEQVLLNLAVNARDAMPDGGTLTIETEQVELDEAEAQGRFDAASGIYILLRVSDTGGGMDATIRARAFEPFFTTKPAGEGTGLGLATVFGSVRQSGGSIALASEPGAGATFEILLPLATAPIQPGVEAPAVHQTSGSERILLVEDEEVVRNLVRDILTRRGYHLLVAADGAEALHLADSQSFDLLLTDMVMPRMSGKELILELRRTRPDLPVVCMSGYAHDAAGDDGLTPGDTFIQKPFTAHDLSNTVRAALNESATPTAVTTGGR